MTTKFIPHRGHVEVPVEHRRPLIPSKLTDSRLFLGWGPRV